jgi:putative NIF3 family GTP cyclohydrolase 1 type 2
MKAVDIYNHFINLADWVDPKNTVDGIILGDPDREIRKVLVTWISSFEAIRAAVKRKVDMLITHESTFWNHSKEREIMGDTKIGSIKKTFIEKNGLVILRNHDVWDRMPEIGIPWAWARFLGLETKPAVVGARGFQHRYDIDSVTVDELARKIADKTATIGEPLVQVIGDGSQKVSKVGIGTGCGCNIYAYLEMECDVSVVCDDGSSYWAYIQYAADSNHPVIRVNHGTSEEPGMVTLTKYVNDNFPGVKAEHLPHGCSFRLTGEK